MSMYDFPPIELPPAPVANVTYRGVMEAVASDTSLTGMQRSRIRLAMAFRPRARDAVLGYLSQEAGFRGVVLQEGMFGFDWESLLAFIRELLPLILEIIAIFT